MSLKLMPGQSEALCRHLYYNPLYDAKESDLMVRTLTVLVANKLSQGWIPRKYASDFDYDNKSDNYTNSCWKSKLKRYSPENAPLLLEA